MSPLLEDVLLQCRSRGWVSSATAERVRSLCDRGLHLEQALLGTGVLDVDRYGEALSEVSGLPFVRMPAEGIEAEPDVLTMDDARAFSAWPFHMDPDADVVRVGFADPDLLALDQVRRLAQESGWEMEPYVVLWSDVRPMVKTVAVPTRPARISERSGFSWPPEGYRPAPGLTVVAVEAGADPVAWPEQKDWREDQPLSFDAMDEEGREEAVHAALAGREVVAVAPRNELFWMPAALAGVPVRIWHA